MPSRAQALPLRGRDVEVADLIRALDLAASGRLSVAVIEGEPGIGKSRLLSEVLEVGRARGMEVRTARALELERSRPFGVLVDALDCTSTATDPRRRAIAELLATRGGEAGAITVSSDAGLRFQAVDGFVDLVEVSALERPMLLGLDDLQWADPSSLLALDALVRDLRHLPVAIVCCLRPAPRLGEASALMRGFEAAGARVIALEGLDRDALAALVRDSLDADPGERLLAELAVAHGNPLFILELLDAIRHDGAVKLVEGSAEADGVGRAPTLRLNLVRRLSNLSEDALEVLRAASVLGARFWVTDLMTTTGRSVLALSSALREAAKARILEEDGDRLRFRHDLIREAVYADMPESVRLAMHREAGQRLADSGASALQVAEHLTRSASVGDSQAVHWLSRAAREVATSSPLVAAALLEQAADLSEPNDPGRDGLLAERAVSLLWAGRLPQAEEACRDMLAREHDSAVDGSIHTCLVNLLLTQGRTAEALHQLDEVLASSTLSEAERVTTWALMAIAHSSRGEVSMADAATQQARNLSETVHDPIVRALLLCGQSMVCQMRAELSQALIFADEAVRVADNSPDRLAHRYPLRLTQARILLDLDRLTEARAALETGQQINQRVGAHWMGPLLDTTLAVERFMAGEWDDALAEAETADKLAREVDEGYITALRLSVVALIALHRGDLSGARTAMDLTGSAPSDDGPRYRSSWFALAQALLLEAQGAATEGVAVLAKRWDNCIREGLAVAYPVIGPELVRLALLTAQQSLAGQVSAAVIELAATQDVASFAGAAMRCRGLVERNPHLSLAAADAYLRAGRPLETALTREEGAALLSGDTAIPLLNQARDGFEQLGAVRDLARVDARLRALGVRRGRRGTRRRPTSGWDSLTETECTVVALVAEGLSNRQVGERLFVSRRTVQTHLAHVFTKLDISSRAQLAAEAARRG